MESANYASYKIGLVRVSSVICKTLNTNFSVNMYYVNVKIKTKNTVGIEKRMLFQTKEALVFKAMYQSTFLAREKVLNFDG